MFPSEVTRIKWKWIKIQAVPRIFGSALANLKKARAKVAERYNAVRQRAEFCVGDLVMVRLHPHSSKVNNLPPS
jgi:hypothetical protein